MANESENGRRLIIESCYCLTNKSFLILKKFRDLHYPLEHDVVYAIGFQAPLSLFSDQRLYGRNY